MITAIFNPHKAVNDLEADTHPDVRFHSQKRVFSCSVFLFVFPSTTLISPVLSLSTALPLTPAESLPHIHTPVSTHTDIPAFAPPYMQIDF